MYYFTITRDDDGYRARFYSRQNGKLIWWTEGYTDRRNAVEAIRIIRRNASGADEQ
jgi:uncharacterized protein YegP (UPF0339 family)